MTYGLAAMAYTILLWLVIQKNQYRGDNVWLAAAVSSSVLWAVIHCAFAVSGVYTTNAVFLFISYIVPFVDWLKGVLWVIFLYNHLRIIWNSQGNSTLSKRFGGLITAIASIGFLIELIYILSVQGSLERGIVGDLPVYNKFFLSFAILLLVKCYCCAVNGHCNITKTQVVRWYQLVPSNSLSYGLSGCRNRISYVDISARVLYSEFWW